VVILNVFEGFAAAFGQLKVLAGDEPVSKSDVFIDEIVIGNLGLC